MLYSRHDKELSLQWVSVFGVYLEIGQQSNVTTHHIFLKDLFEIFPETYMGCSIRFRYRFPDKRRKTPEAQLLSWRPYVNSRLGENKGHRACIRNLQHLKFASTY